MQRYPGICGKWSKELELSTVQHSVTVEQSRQPAGNVSHLQQSAEEMPEIEPIQKDKKESNEKLTTAPSLIIPIQRASSYSFLDLQ